MESRCSAGQQLALIKHIDRHLLRFRQKTCVCFAPFRVFLVLDAFLELASYNRTASQLLPEYPGASYHPCRAAFSNSVPRIFPTRSKPANKSPASVEET